MDSGSSLAKLAVYTGCFLVKANFAQVRSQDKSMVGTVSPLTSFSAVAGLVKRTRLVLVGEGILFFSDLNRTRGHQFYFQEKLAMRASLQQVS